MEENPFGTLSDVNLREAWRDEARNFTPWLAGNLDRLGEALGIELELVRAEAGLPTDDDRFSADILARDVRQNCNVLIENQLEGSDHSHLGQILTYLAGLEARTVIWVAHSFRESHLAALKWLNENTREEFAFFAVRVRVVKIGDSALAPLFEIAEKPNAWERRTQQKVRASSELSELGLKRRSFWQKFQDRYPQYAVDGIAGGTSNMWRSLANPNLVISYYLSRDKVGLFLRGSRRIKSEETEEMLEPYIDLFTDKLGTEMGAGTGDAYFVSRLTCDYGDESQFESISDWLNEKIGLYETVVNGSVAIAEE